ncbi:MAG: hypothetical protein PVG22_12230 [Chromatiales bacterium]|jgi:hypothetical protein
MKRLGQLAIVGGCLALCNPLQAAVIDFETLPGGGTPKDDQLLTSAYTIDGVTVEFMVDDNQDGTWEAPRFEQTGKNGFLDPWGYTSAAGRDTPLAGYEEQQGDFFLRTNTNSYGSFPTTNLRILYTSALGPVTAASGEIWDIDRNYEQWLVSAYDDQGTLLDQILSPKGTDEPPDGTTSQYGGLDGRPWTFGFTGLSDIHEILVEYVGSVTTVGLAFNNFSPVVSLVDPPEPVPEPSPLLLMAVGLGVLGMARSWKNSQSPS